MRNAVDAGTMVAQIIVLRAPINQLAGIKPNVVVVVRSGDPDGEQFIRIQCEFTKQLSIALICLAGRKRFAAPHL